jgi:hypothetical protein
MKEVKNESVLVAGLYTEWLSNSMAYQQQLDDMETMLRLIGSTSSVLVVNQLVADIGTVRRKLDLLLDKIENAQFNFYQLDNDAIQISFGEMMARRQLRDEIRKTEQSIFLLRYSVGQLMQKVS